MVNFKDIVLRDNFTFTNGREFAELIELNEVKIWAVVRRYNGDPKFNFKINHNINPGKHGVSLSDDYVTLYFQDNIILRHGDFVRFNGEKFKVEEFQSAFGITRLIISADKMKQPKLPRPREGI